MVLVLLSTGAEKPLAETQELLRSLGSLGPQVGSTVSMNGPIGAAPQVVSMTQELLHLDFPTLHCDSLHLFLD